MVNENTADTKKAKKTQREETLDPLTGLKESGIIQKDVFNESLKNLMGMGEVIGPVRQEDNTTLFAPLQSPEDIDLDYTNTGLSPKGCLFPQTEVLFYYEKKHQEITPSPVEEKARFLVGIRPCDSRALTVLDPVFDDPQYKDIPYLQRRKNLTIIGLACNHPQTTCFCTSTGGSPHDSTGMDILLQDLGDRYLVQGITEKGKGLMLKLKGIEKAGEKDLKEAQEQGKKVLSGMEPCFCSERVPEKLETSFEDSFWETIYEKCIGCSTCSFVCPTCHCFDIQDENSGDKGRRVRLWDCCMFPLFTLHASGHNPRPSGKERMRQRIMHKFCYFKLNTGQIACVGCGRCIRQCPVNIDIREIVSACES